MRKLKPAFVVTVSALGAACGSYRTENPPRPEPADAPTSQATAAVDAGPSGTLVPTASPSSAPAAFTRQLNAKTAEGAQIYRVGSGCVIHVQGPPAGSWQPPTTKSVECPPSMKDDAWSKCDGGTLSATEDLSACLCSVDGNPPPPDWQAPCPKAK